MAAMTATANEVTRCTKDDGEGEVRQRRQRETKGDDTGDSGDKRDGEGRRTSHFDAYLYLIQAIYIQAEAEKALGETQRNTIEPAT